MSRSAQAYDQIGNPARVGDWSFSVETSGAPSLGITKY
jgi:hypothetical protein